LEIGGITPKASAVKKKIFFGLFAIDGILIFLM
jgi:hypothetical protein